VKALVHDGVTRQQATQGRRRVHGSSDSPASVTQNDTYELTTGQQTTHECLFIFTALLDTAAELGPTAWSWCG